ncbi:hypothetical protein [Nocardia sp. NPDC047038]|uniref:hypothetical protein n=1 Tax=Nocardia sp. NPDC047038 TaxID=3154338 RepID=UPI0033E7D0EA
MDIDITCPSCGRLDWVQSVPALCSDGTSVSMESGSYSGFGVSSSGLVPVFGTMTVDRTHTTALANSFAREPDWKPTRRLTRVGWMLLVPAFLMLIVLAIGTVGEEPGRAQMSMAVSGVFMVGVYASPGLLTLAAARGRRRHNNRILRGRPHAHALWRAGFYCHRCGTAFWPYSPVAGIPVRQSLSPQQFRWHVWKVGCYNDTR